MTTHIPNQNIRDYLDYYFSLSAPPKYGIMIKGKWGSGKTHLIQTFMKGSRHKSLYVSLNGLSSTKQIEEEFFRLLHPVLSSPRMRLAGKLLQSLIKTSVNFDWNKDGKPDGNASFSLPDVDFSTYFDDAANAILIFDDLERCNIPINQILGYINYFVEHGSCKVIVLADEDHFESPTQGAALTDYHRVREKVIGKTFEVELDQRAAIKVFCEEIQNLNARKVVEENRDFIEQIFNASTYKNLRHIRQALLEFSRVVDEIQVQVYSWPMLKSLLGTMLAYSLETMSGRLKPQDISALDQILLLRAVERDDSPSIAAEIDRKYSHLGVLDSFIPDLTWSDFFYTGAFDRESLNTHVRQSTFYTPNNDRPAWLRLWKIYSSDDHDIFDAITEAYSKYLTFTFDSISEFLNITGSLIQLTKLNITSFNGANLVMRAKICIDYFEACGMLDDLVSGMDYDCDSSFGYRHHGQDSSEYKIISIYLKTACRSAAIASYPTRAQNLLAMLAANVQEFGEIINGTTSSRLDYPSTPILSYIGVKEFLGVLDKMEAANLGALCKIFKTRYRYSPHDLATEEHWLRDVANGVEELISKRGRTMKAYWLSELHRLIIQTLAGFDDRKLKRSALS